MFPNVVGVYCSCVRRLAITRLHIENVVAEVRCGCLKGGQKCVDKLRGGYVDIVHAREKLMQFERLEDQDTWLVNELRCAVVGGSPAHVFRCIPACALSFIRLRCNLYRLPSV
jgi:hypothetical protein